MDSGFRRNDIGDGSPPPSSRGQAIREDKRTRHPCIEYGTGDHKGRPYGRGMGLRIREDNEWGLGNKTGYFGEMT